MYFYRKQHTCSYLFPAYVICYFHMEAIPLELFRGSKVNPLMWHFHHFGCPVYVLNSKMASGKKLPKWENRTQVAIYLGKSPNHARSVSLALSSTGMVSLQYHCRFDDLFETVSGKGVSNIPESKWQEKAHFVSETKEATHEQVPKQQGEGGGSLGPLCRQDPTPSK